VDMVDPRTQASRIWRTITNLFFCLWLPLDWRKGSNFTDLSHARLTSALRQAKGDAICLKAADSVQAARFCLARRRGVAL